MCNGGGQVGQSVTAVVFVLSAFCHAAALASQGVTDYHHHHQQHLQIAVSLSFRRSDSALASSWKLRRRQLGEELSELDSNRSVRRTKREAVKERGSDGRAETPLCSLIPHDPDLPRIVSALRRNGETHLVEYSLTFPEYSVDPLEAVVLRASVVGDDNSFVYKSRSWRRVMSSQGEALVSFAFNYDALSLGLLSHGVRRIDVPLVDSPPLCFANESADRKVSLLLELLLADFRKGSNGDGTSAEQSASNGRTGIDNDPWKDSRTDFVCHQTVRNDSGIAEFARVCCGATDKTNCVSVKPDRLLSVLSLLLASFKILTFLFGPILIRRIVFSGPTGMTRYLVPLSSDMQKTMLVRRVPFGRCEPAAPKRRKTMQQFAGFRRLLKDLRSEEVVRIRFRQLDVIVDDRDLMSEDEVPVGVLSLLFDAFVRCRTVASVEPFRTCCGESVIGSWAPYFLWIRLKKHVSDCNRGCREICSWASVFRGIGGLLLMTAIALPFHARLVVFERFEKKETEDRSEVRSQLQLDDARCLDLLRCLTPDHLVVIAVQVLFAVSYLVLLVARAANSESVDRLLLRSVADMQALRRVECLRLLCAHVVLPFEKFGCLCGAVAAALYWPLALPLCLAVGLFYCVPTVYLVGRLLAAKRPRCLRTHPLSSPVEGPEANGGGSLSEGVTSFGSCLMLNRISVDDAPVTSQAESSADERSGIASSRPPPPRLPFSRATVARALATGLIKASAVVCMLSLLVMYSEALGFLLELTVFVSVGVIANAHHSVATVILVVLALLYVTTSYRRVYTRYLKLSRRIFQYIKDSLQHNVESACVLRMERSLDTAFRFSVEIGSAKATPKLSPPSCLRSENHAEQIAAAGENGARKESDASAESRNQSHPCDDSKTKESEASVEYRNDRLHWKIRSLVLFVDKNDKPRIPRELFWRLCEELDFPGNPGSLRQSLARATVEAAAALLYLAAVYAVVSLSSEMQHSTTVVQAIVIFGLGAIPALIAVTCGGRFFQTEFLQLNEYSLNGKVRRAILGYERTWLIHDLLFSRGGDDFEGEATIDQSNGEARGEGSQTRKTPGGRSSSFDPSQVDLLITVRDDEADIGARPEVSAPGHGGGSSSPRGSSRGISSSDAQKLGRHAAIPPRNVTIQRNAKCLSDPLNSAPSSRQTDDAILDAS